MASQTVQALRDQLIGSWMLVYHYTELLSDPTNKYYPLGPDARGLIVYTPDGYMSAQLVRPGQAPFDDGAGLAPELHGTPEDWEQVGRRYIAYCGRFFINEEDGQAMLYHELSVCVYPRLTGQVQKRAVRFEEEDGVMYLNLGIDSIELDGEMRAVKVRWRRAANNADEKLPGMN